MIVDLEPGTSDAIGGITFENDQQAALIYAVTSAAISLRRIADELAVNAPGSKRTTFGDLVERIADAMPAP